MTQYALNSPAVRNNFSGWVGMKLYGGRKRDQRDGAGAHLPGREQRDAHG